MLGQFGALPIGDHPADDIAAEDVEDDVEIEVGPLGRTPQFGNIPAPELVGTGGQQFRLLVGRMDELIAALAILAFASRSRYMVRTEQRYWPSSSSVA